MTTSHILSLLICLPWAMSNIPNLELIQKADLIWIQHWDCVDCIGIYLWKMWDRHWELSWVLLQEHGEMLCAVCKCVTPLPLLPPPGLCVLRVRWRWSVPASLYPCQSRMGVMVQELQLTHFYCLCQRLKGTLIVLKHKMDKRDCTHIPSHSNIPVLCVETLFLRQTPVPYWQSWVFKVPCEATDWCWMPVDPAYK